MVKIPNFDDLKKMGTGLIDSAKSVKFGEVVDKMKSGIESVSSKRTTVVSDEGIQTLFEGITASLNELVEVQATQTAAIKKIQNQFVDLSKAIAANQQTKTEQTMQSEDKST